MSAKEAVAEFVHDGDIVYLGFGASFCPFALAYELIRQGKKDLDLVGGTPQPQLQQLLFASGLATRTRSGAITGIRGPKPGRIWDLAEQGAFQFEDYSNLTCTLMLMAGALGMPFIPTQSFLGTDFLKQENLHHKHGFLGDGKLRVIEDPYSGKPVVALPALKPGVALWHAQRADEYGNVQSWGMYADARWGLWAAERVVVSVEEIVPTEVVRSDPNRTIIPGPRVSAVVHQPYGGFPGEMPGHYMQDGAMLRLSPDAVPQYLAEWVYGCADHDEFLQRYVEKYGFLWFQGFLPKHKQQPIGSVDYGYRGVHGS